MAGNPPDPTSYNCDWPDLSQPFEPWPCWFCNRMNSHPGAHQMRDEGLIHMSRDRLYTADGTNLANLILKPGESREQAVRRLSPRGKGAPPHLSRASTTSVIEPRIHDETGQISANGQWMVMEAEQPERKNVCFEPRIQLEAAE
ncbi:hypothetical protein BS47DRAFT_1364144 [Hydnum rufescens UP504]|uniref:Uncharacterized protein n=1 Tax=Hydnum rufescens UP504 TaxID=1448309 RepID=A0A9P6AS79_9AGAM|nr:hypothetical protein BS47DRAFT_1364144 [Hydnum rufescens UP504]